MQFTDIKPGIIGLTTSFGASICCVLPMTIVLLGLGSGGFMMITMQYRIILYPLGLVTCYLIIGCTSGVNNSVMHKFVRCKENVGM